LEILRGYDMDISRALLSQPFSTLTMGSEFRPVYILDPLCQYHPLWSRVREWLLVMDHESCLYSQWFPGIENEIADSLSRDFHLSDADLLRLFTSHVPDQMPEGLVIFPLPDVLASQIIMWMQNLPASTELPTAPVRSKLTTGTVLAHLP
jgi:hypothetical protein